MGKGDKTEQFFVAVANQNLGGIRFGLGVGGVLPTTRNGDDHTPFLMATVLNKDRSLSELIRYYDRKVSMLRQCLEQTDANGNTPMHLACKQTGGTKCLSVLLDAWHTVNAKNLEAGLLHKNNSGKTPGDVAGPKQKQVIKEWLTEPEEEEGDDDGIDADGLTSTQRSKLKKKKLKEEMEAAKLKASSKGATGDGEGGDNVTAADESTTESPAGRATMPEPIWDEVKGWVQSVGKNKPICELNINRRAGGRADIDPALWWCDSLNRLELQLPKESLTVLDGTGLGRLTNLTHLILSGHKLTGLPDSITTLKKLKSLDVRDNSITSLPALPKTLESLDVSTNYLTTVDAIKGCVNLVSLAVDGNELVNLDALDFKLLTRLVTLSASSNVLAQGPVDVGLAAKLETLVLSNNPIDAVPTSVASLKKLKTLKVDGCKLKDKKVSQYIDKGDIKTLGKYLEKNSGRGGGKKKK